MDKRIRIHDTPLAGVTVIERMPLSDHRGSLERMFCADELRPAGFVHPIAQIVRTLTKKAGTVRGLHFQWPPHAEMKLVSCLRGSVFDVAVDLRANSPTYLRWHGEILSETNMRSMLIPEGVAHGFQTLAADSELLYCMSTAYAPQAEGGLHINDEALAIAWPAPIAEMSERDANLPRIAAGFAGIDT